MNWDELSRASLDDIVAWAADQPWCRAMADCRQDAAWHSEGDVWTHTQMVCSQLPQLDDWAILAPHERTVLTFTALFHDSGKPLTSKLDTDTGRITSPKHALKGEHLARSVLRDLGCDLTTREEIARMVRFHGRPAFLRCTVTMMSGLPGSGKDTWLAANRPDLPVVSLDGVRSELDIEATDDQGEVIQVARERCRELLRSGRSFAFNATNLLRRTRQRWIDVFADYGARIEVVYVEPAMPIILGQNRRRERPVPEKVIRELAARCEPPTLTEGHGLTIVCEGADAELWKAGEREART